MFAGVNIKPEKTELEASILIEFKKSKDLHVCVDYHKLNALNKQDSCPISCLNDCFDLLGEATLFSTLGGSSGYLQIETEVSKTDKIVIILHQGSHSFIPMYFRLKNVSDTFQRTMDVIIFIVKWYFALVSLDNIVIFSKTPDQQIDRVFIVISLLYNAEATLELKNCNFSSDTIDYLGHLIFVKRLERASHAMHAIRGLKTPNQVHQTEVFYRLMQRH